MEPSAEAPPMTGGMEGQTVLITGGARGMGRVAALALAGKGAHVILVDWEGEEGTRTRDQINARGLGSAQFLYCDVSSLAEVVALAAAIRSQHEKIDVLINNAGITDPVRRLSVDKHDMHFATCHLGHYVLTHGVLELLRNAGGARIIMISSDAHKAGPGLDFDDIDNAKLWGGKPISSNGAFLAYHRAKLCNIYMMQELSARLASDTITVNAVSPGYFVNTTIYRNMRGIFAVGCNIVFGLGSLLGLNTPQKGARTHIYLASSPAVEGVSGKYFEHCKPKEMGAQADNPDARARLWTLSEELTGLKFPAP